MVFIRIERFKQLFIFRRKWAMLATNGSMRRERYKDGSQLPLYDLQNQRRKSAG